MLPGNVTELSAELDQETDYETDPSLTYRLNEDYTISGLIDGSEAIRQAVEKILRTERYENLVYSWDYGSEMNDLSGQEIEYVIPELKRRIQEALEQDDRIESVDSFAFTVNERSIHAGFVVHSIFGDMDAETEVNLYV